MASLNTQQAGRDAADYAADRHDPRFTHYREAADATPLEADKVAALAKAEATMEAAFGTWDRAKGRYVRTPEQVVAKAALFLNMAA